VKSSIFCLKASQHPKKLPKNLIICENFDQSSNGTSQQITKTPPNKTLNRLPSYVDCWILPLFPLASWLFTKSSFFHMKPFAILPPSHLFTLPVATVWSL